MTPKNVSVTQKWFDAGVAEAQKGRDAFKRLRGHIIDAGFFFIRARDSAPHGDWLLFLEVNSAKMKARTVQRYMQLSEAALEWAKAQCPELRGPKLDDAARSCMMMSPKPLVALLRDLRELRPFGEYDAVKYAQRKLGQGQLELDFSKCDDWFTDLEHIGEPNFVLKVPEGKTEAQALAEIRDRCQSIAAKAIAQLKASATIDL